MACGLGDRFSYDEVFGELKIIFIKSYSMFDPEKATKFSTYFVHACQNYVTNRIEKALNREPKIDSVEDLITQFDDGTTADLFETFGEDPMVTESIALESELSFLRKRMSPLAQKLLDFSLNPPEFIKQEYFAQRARYSFASCLGMRSTCRSEIDLRFVANCLKATVNTAKAKTFIDKAVIEVEQTVMQAISA